VATAAQLGGIELPSPDCSEGTHWFVGLHQQFSLEVGSARCQGTFRGLELGVQLGPLALAAMQLGGCLIRLPDGR